VADNELNNENLLAWAQAQLDRNRLLQDANTLERRRQGIQFQVIEAAASLTQEVRLLIGELRRKQDSQDKQWLWLDKVIEDLANRMDRQERNMALLLTEGNRDDKLDAAQVLENERSIRTQLKKHYKNLNKLNEQAAEHGTDIPLNLLNKIEAEQAVIAGLEDRLNG